MSEHCTPYCDQMSNKDATASSLSGDLTPRIMRATRKFHARKRRTPPHPFRHRNMIRMVPRISMLVVAVIVAMDGSSNGPRIRGGALAFVPNSPAPIVPKRRIRQQPPSVSSSALFGIKGFRGWFEKTFPSAVVPIPKGSKGAPPHEQHSESFDHVLIDANQLLHIAMRRSHSPSHPSCS